MQTFNYQPKKYLFVLFIIFSNSLFAQVNGVAINDDNSSADVSAILDVNINAASAKKGLLIPRVTTTQRDAISLPATSLLIFNTTTNWFEYNEGTPASPKWVPLVGWKITGNAGTTPGTNFIGTTDDAGFLFKINNSYAGYIDNSTTSNNLYLGLGAGNYGTTSGTKNIALGYNTLSTNTSGSNNTAIGYNALGSNTTASNNVAIGYNATTNNSNTVVIGASAQANNTQATAIGNATQADGSNSAAIGNGATTTQNNAFILGNSSVNVGIGTSTPNTSTKLDVNGGFKLGANGTALTNMYKTSVTVTIPVISLLNTSSVTFAVANAPLNSTVIVNPRTPLPAGIVVGTTYVSSANNVTIVFGALVALAFSTSRTFDVTVIY